MAVLGWGVTFLIVLVFDALFGFAGVATEAAAVSRDVFSILLLVVLLLLILVFVGLGAVTGTP